MLAVLSALDLTALTALQLPLFLHPPPPTSMHSAKDLAEYSTLDGYDSGVGAIRQCDLAIALCASLGWPKGEHALRALRQTIAERSWNSAPKRWDLGQYDVSLNFSSGSQNSE